jgi:hypothetical protein
MTALNARHRTRMAEVNRPYVTRYARLIPRAHALGYNYDAPAALNHGRVPKQRSEQLRGTIFVRSPRHCDQRPVDHLGGRDVEIGSLDGHAGAVTSRGDLGGAIGA